MPQSKEPIPEEFASLAEIQDFWDRNSSADYWDEMTDVEVELAPSLRTKIELKKLYRLLGLSPADIARIEAEAASAKTESRQLMRRWILEHV